MSDIKPIETLYSGVKFRSRLEARWAVFFDALGVRWQYEFEGYQTKFGAYVPDFWLPDVRMRNLEKPGVLFEVKPSSYKSSEHDALAEVANNLGVSAILAVNFNFDSWDCWRDLYQIASWWDNNMMIYACACGTVKFDYETGSYYECPKCGKSEYGEVHIRIRAAYDKAIAQRFWDGSR